MCMLQNDIVASANTSITSHNYCLFFVVKTLKVYSVSSFQACITVLSTIISGLYFISSELIHLITGGLPCWTSISLFSPTPQPLVTTTLLSVSMSLVFFFFLDSSYKWYHTIFVFPCHLTCLQVSSMLSQMVGSPPFSWLKKSLSMHM